MTLILKSGLKLNIRSSNSKKNNQSRNNFPKILNTDIKKKHSTV